MQIFVPRFVIEIWPLLYCFLYSFYLQFGTQRLVEPNGRMSAFPCPVLTDSYRFQPRMTDPYWSPGKKQDPARQKR